MLATNVSRLWAARVSEYQIIIETQFPKHDDFLKHQNPRCAKPLLVVALFNWLIQF